MNTIIDTLDSILIKFPIIIALTSGIMFFLLIKSKDIIIIFKRKLQRTEEEKSRIEHGLIKSLLLEIFIFIPISIFLFHLAIMPFIIDKLLSIKYSISAWYALMGIIAYGFPFATVKGFVTKMALNTLIEFAKIAEHSEKSNGTE